MSLPPLHHGRLYFAPLGYQQLSCDTATGVTAPASSTIMEVTVEAQAIRYRDDGTAPTSSVGMPVAVGNSFQYAGDMSAIQFIAQTSGAVLNISFYK